MIYVYIFILMLLSWGLSFLTEYIPKQVLSVIMWTMTVLMLILAATKPFTTASDYNNYLDMFNNYDSLKYELSVEPTYLYISRFVNSVGGPFRVMTWIYAIIALPLKMYALRRISSYDLFFAGLPIYLSNFFLLHDTEQIRLGAAMAFVIMAYVYRTEGKKWYVWVPVWLLATTFHYTSAVALAPLMLCSQKPLSQLVRVMLSVLVFAGVVIWVLKINLISLIPIPLLEAKMALYELSISKGEEMETILLYHPIALLRYATFFYVLCFYDTIRQYFKHINIVLIAEALGLFAWGGLSETAVFAVRISELFQVPEFLLFASVMYTLRPSWVGRVYVMGVAMYILLYGIRINQFGYI